VDKWIRKIRRMSVSQLRALKVLAESEKGVIESSETSGQTKLKGKSLGGVFSSLSRQQIDGLYMIEAWGRSVSGRGLRWRLNPKTISRSELKRVVKEVLEV